jgi:peptidyl-prolyl cis-trans isomerase D
MLQMLRDSMKYLAWILWVVIAVFVLFVFVDFGRGNYGGPGGANAAAATVAGQPITRLEFDRERQQLEEMMRQQLGEQFSPELAAQLQLPMQALNRLVANRILLGEADRLGLAVSDQELRRYIVEIFKDEQGNFVGAERYRMLVRRRGYTPESFEQSVREGLLVERVRGALRDAVFVSDAEVEESYRQQNEKTKLRYVSLPFGAALGPPATDAEVQRWFDQHREEYRLPEQRLADYLLVDQTKLEQSLAITDEELRAYYQQHQEEYAQPEQLRARHILLETEEQARAAQARLAAGEDFAEVAREMSKDGGSGANGGDLGWFGRGRMVPPFEQAAFAATIGEVVGPVQSNFGYHLIEVQERRAAVTSPFEQVKPALRMRLVAERGAQVAEERAKALAAEVKKAGTNAPQKMQELAAQPGLEVGRTEPFGRQGNLAPLGAAPAANAAGFTLQKGGVSDPVRTPRGWLVLHLAEIRPPRLPELADVRDRVRRAVEQDQRRREAFARLEKARAEAGGGAPLDAIAQKLGVLAQETPEFGRGTSVPGIGYAPELVKAASSAPVGTLAGPVVVASSALLYQVSSRTGVDPAQLAAQKETLREQLEQEQMNALLTSLINQRKQELGVTYDPQLLEAIEAAGRQPGMPTRG